MLAGYAAGLASLSIGTPATHGAIMTHRNKPATATFCINEAQAELAVQVLRDAADAYRRIGQQDKSDMLHAVFGALRMADETDRIVILRPYADAAVRVLRDVPASL
jgi:hypothetical protein